MNDPPHRESLTGQALPRHVRADAAAWVARLHSDYASAGEESDFRAWLEASELHRLAFERATASWDAAGGYAAEPPSEDMPMLTRRRMLAGTTIAGVATAGAAWLWSRGSAQSFATGRGEQLRTVLADGSRLILDSDTRVSVRLGKHERRLSLDGGRAYFAVSHDRARPFSVEIDGREVVAVGTAFAISRDTIGAAVTLVDGKVLVRGEGAPVAMQAGDRVSFNDRTGRMRRDRPDVGRLTAWERGLLVFDNDTLASVVTEANRYSSKPLRIVDPTLSMRRVSGTFQIGDGAELAHALGPLLDIAIVTHRDAILIGGSAAEISATP